MSSMVPLPSVAEVCIWRSPRMSRSPTTRGGEAYFPARFAQLRRNPVEAKLGVDLLLGLARHAARPLEQAVLVELVAVLLGDLAELDVVGLGPREVLQGGAVGRGLD